VLMYCTRLLSGL